MAKSKPVSFWAVPRIIRSVFVTFELEGLHSYPKAPEAVSFLRDPHRHMFKYRIEISVEHNEREIEFILLKRNLQGLAQENQKHFPMETSCETMAEKLVDYLSRIYPDRSGYVEVSEDGENGARLVFEK